MQVFNRVSFLMLLALVIGCANGRVAKKEQPPQPVGISEITALEVDWIVDQRVTQRILIDDKEIFVGIFQVRDQMQNTKNIYVLKSDNRLFVNKTGDGQIELLSWSDMPRHFHFEPYTLPDRQINVKELTTYLQKSLYFDLFHCRKVNEYHKIVDLAISERPYLYLQPSRDLIEDNMVGRGPSDWVFKYNLRTNRIESSVYIQKASSFVKMDSIDIVGNITENSGRKLLDNLLYRADAFRFRCRGPYWYNLNIITKDGWKPNHFISFDPAIDDKASYFMNQDIKTQSLSGSAFEEQFEGLSVDVFDDFKKNFRGYEKLFSEKVVDVSLAKKLGLLK